MKLATFCLAGLLASGLALGQGTSDEPPPAPEMRVVEILDQARISSEETHRYHLETLSCGELEQIASSQQPADQAVVAMLMVWAHGYQSGLKGLNFEARPIDLESMLSLMQSVLRHCEKSPDKLFHIAVTEIDAGARK